jgi:hypothetical protein
MLTDPNPDDPLVPEIAHVSRISRRENSHVGGRSEADPKLRSADVTDLQD